MTKWPSFAGLRSFEAVARHGSLAEAGRNLSMTPSGVSHRIRDLEMFFQVTLFHRDGRRYRLTPEGELLYKSVSQSLDTLSAAITDVSAHRASTRLRVRTPGGFGQLFLSPRLNKFIKRNKNIEISVGSYTRLSDEDEDEVDITIRRKSNSSVFESEKFLIEEELVPICSPDYAQELVGLMPNDDSIRIVGVSSDSERGKHYADWNKYLATMGFGDTTVRYECHFNQLAAALDYVLSSGGVVLANYRFILQEIETGKIQQPWTMRMKTGVVLTATINRTARDKVAAKKFILWLEQEARQVADVEVAPVAQQ